MALAATLQDNFNLNSISASWSASANSNDSTQVTNVAGIININHTAAVQYNALQSASTYDLTGSSFFVEIINVGNQALTSHEVILYCRIDANNQLWFTISGSTLAAFKKVAGVQAQVGSSITYSLNTHKWLRMRESGGTTFWDTSPDSSNWTNRWSLASPFAVTALNLAIQSGCYNLEASSSFGQFDNFNFPRAVRFNNSGLRPHPFSPGLAR